MDEYGMGMPPPITEDDIQKRMTQEDPRILALMLSGDERHREIGNRLQAARLAARRQAADELDSQWKQRAMGSKAMLAGQKGEPYYYWQDPNSGQVYAAPRYGGGYSFIVPTPPAGSMPGTVGGYVPKLGQPAQPQGQPPAQPWNPVLGDQMPDDPQPGDPRLPNLGTHPLPPPPQIATPGYPAPTGDNPVQEPISPQEAMARAAISKLPVATQDAIRAAQTALAQADKAGEAVAANPEAFGFWVGLPSTWNNATLGAVWKNWVLNPDDVLAQAKFKAAFNDLMRANAGLAQTLGETQNTKFQIGDVNLKPEVLAPLVENLVEDTQAKLQRIYKNSLPGVRMPEVKPPAKRKRDDTIPTPGLGLDLSAPPQRSLEDIVKQYGG